MTARRIHEYTPTTVDVARWAARHHPTSVIEHTPECLETRTGDSCAGGCPVIETLDGEE